MSIYKYQKVSGQFGPINLRLEPQQRWCELATVNGDTYVFVEGALPEQDEALTVVEVSLTPELKDQISSASRACAVINEQVVEMIRQRYSVEDEIKCLRIAPSPETQAWNDYVEECRAWGRDQKAAIGL